MSRAGIGPATAPGEMTGSAARRALGGITPVQLQKLVVLGKVRCVARPGEPFRYLREDVERIAAEAK